MSSAHEKYLYAHNELHRAKLTRALINSPYEGGGGGIGHIVRREAKITVYHQPYNGANNYHDFPEKLNEALGNLITVEMIDKAIEVMQADVRKLAKEAAEELQRLLAGGLSVAS